MYLTTLQFTMQSSTYILNNFFIEFCKSLAIHYHPTNIYRIVVSLINIQFFFIKVFILMFIFKLLPTLLKFVGFILLCQNIAILLYVSYIAKIPHCSNSVVEV